MNESSQPDSESDTPLKYWAFISYSHKDDRWAAWLHQALERYAVPRQLIGTRTSAGPVPHRLYPVFRDKEELPSSASLSASVREALSRSRNLIVVCSPNSASSRWVEEEVLFFKAIGRADRIFSLIVDGEPGGADDTASGLPEAFPRALRFQLGPDGKLSQERSEPLSADVRDRKAPRRLALLRLVAGLLAIDYDGLVKRDARARWWRRAKLAAAGSIVLTIGALAWYRQHIEFVHEANVASLRQLIQDARRMIGPDRTELYTGVLLAVEAVHRAMDLNEPPETALQVVRDGLSVLPAPVAWRLESAPRELAGAEFSSDGVWLCGLDNRTLRVWDASTGRLVAAIALPDKGVGIAYPSEPGQVVTMTTHGVQTWEVMSQRLLSSREYEEDLDHGATLSKDGRWFIIPGEFNVSLRIVDAATGQTVRELRSEHPIELVRFSTDGAQVVAAVAEQSNVGAQNAGILVWDRESGQVVAQYPHQTYVHAATTAPLTHLVATLAGATVRVIDGDTGRVVQTIPSSAAQADQQGGSIALSREGRWVAVGDGTQVCVSHVATGTMVARLPGHAGVSAFSPNGRLLLTTDGGMWQMDSDAQIARQMSDEASIQGLAIAGTPAVLAHGSRSGLVTLWDLDMSDVTARLKEQPWSRVAAMDPTGRILVVMSGTSIGDQWSARVWDGRSGSMLAELSPQGAIDNVKFSPDGLTVWLLVEGRGAVSFETKHFGTLRTVPVQPSASSLSFSSDGRRLTVGGGGRDTVIDVTNDVANPTLGKAGDPSFPQESSRWELKVAGEEHSRSIAVQRTATAEAWGTLAQEVDEFVVSPDQERLVTLGQNGAIRVQWIQPSRVLDQACRRIGRDLSEIEREKYLKEQTGPPACRAMEFARQ